MLRSSFLIHKKDGNKTNIKNLHFHLSSDEISAQWGYWNDDKKSVQCTIFPGKKKGAYTITFYDKEKNTSCATLIIVE